MIPPDHASNSSQMLSVSVRNGMETAAEMKILSKFMRNSFFFLPSLVSHRISKCNASITKRISVKNSVICVGDFERSEERKQWKKKQTNKQTLLPHFVINIEIYRIILIIIAFLLLLFIVTVGHFHFYLNE